ncbi:MAG: DUF3841 domain-containing protein [Clostridiaceae bacterium]|nr:DUF3841 domain-containing protein [Clostridiaceae bacterium]
METGKAVLWTRQEQRVLDVLENGEIYCVQKAYVDAKYQDVSWSMQTAYGFLIRKMSGLIPPLKGEESPVWLHGSPEATGMFSEAPLLKLEVPTDECLFFDRRKWNCILNLEYIAQSDNDAEAFQKKLKAQGVTHSSLLLRTPYYPLLKMEVIKSWDRLFEAAMPEIGFLQATVWHIKPEWVKTVS